MKTLTTSIVALALVAGAFAQGKEQPRDPGRDHCAGGIDIEDQRVQDKAGSEDDPGLKAAARAKITMPLNVKGKQQDHWDQQFGADGEECFVLHMN